MDGHHILVAVVSAIMGAISAVGAAYFKSSGQAAKGSAAVMTADSARVQQMWDRIDDLEAQLRKERNECDERMKKLEDEHKREMAAVREELDVLRQHMRGCEA